MKTAFKYREKISSIATFCFFVLVLFFHSPDLLLASELSQAIPSDTKISGFFLTSIGDQQVIMPESGRGKNILVAVRDEDDLPAISASLKRTLGNWFSARNRAQSLTPENKYEEALILQFPDLKMFIINSFLPVPVQKRFNSKLDFGGPNCFYTALSVTDGIDQGEVRHVSLNEFRARLALLYTEISTATPAPGDVLLFNSSDHGAVYLGGDRVFHKKDLNKEYYFRMPRKLEVFQADPGEWVPGPNYCGPYSRPHDTKVSKIQIFRRNKTPLAAWSTAINSRPEFPVINLLKVMAMKTAPAWSLGKVMGYWSEILSEELVRDLDKPIKTDESGKQLMTELESVRDQIFIAIEDGYFSSPYAKQKIIKEIWFYDNDYSRAMITNIRNYYGLATDEEALVRICAALKAIDGDHRGKSLLTIIKSDS